MTLLIPDLLFLFDEIHPILNSILLEFYQMDSIHIFFLLLYILHVILHLKTHTK